LVRRSCPRRAFAGMRSGQDRRRLSPAQPLRSRRAGSSLGSECSRNHLKNRRNPRSGAGRGMGENKRGFFSWRSFGASKR
jgi:hypothetical protein